MKRVLPIVAAVLWTIPIVALAATERGPSRQAEACPAGTHIEREPEVSDRAQPGYSSGLGGAEREREREREREQEREREHADEHADEPGREAEGERGYECAPAKKPESFAELAALNGQADSRATAPFTAVRTGALRSAIEARNALGSVPRSGGTWKHLGEGPLAQDTVGYDEINSLGFVDVAGRISEFTRIPGTNTVYVAVAQGGVWRSTNLGDSWTSIGDTLPTQMAGSLAYSSANGGTLIVVTGDNAFGQSSSSGLGAYWSDDDGATWHHSSGVPDGALGMQVAVDPTNPSEVYVATSLGLFRSIDAGRSFVNVDLPTGSCAGKGFVDGCFLANVVTDVVITSPGGTTNHAGGVVLAAVGWRAGTAPDADGRPQAPGNGLYRSTTGARGSFTKLAPAGYAPQNRIGRTELEVARGNDQNHEVVYSVVQDAVVFNGGVPVLDVPEPTGLGPIVFSSVLNGIYASTNVGNSWKQLANAETLRLPGTGSALGVNSLVGYGPGVQGWYNEFLAVDPTMASGGIPTRLVFGLEEVWENDLPGTIPLDGTLPVSWKVIGRYYGGTTCQGSSLGSVVCPTNRPPGQSTTTHPDQHAAMFVADGNNLVLLVGNDGGVYRQSIEPGGDFDNGGWGGGNNDGFNTLLYYEVAMARDGVAYGGLQDNGHAKIQLDGQQIGVFGGDGFDAAVDPNNSKIAYEEYTEGSMSMTTDGGLNWRSINPGLTAGLFHTPFEMDERNAKHLVVGGREIKETFAGPEVETSSATAWDTAFNLGTQDEPGVADANASEESPHNQASALDVDGRAVYVGYCGYCDVLIQGLPFASGIATNAGGASWHIAKAKGLPNRIVTAVAIDPEDPDTVYVGLAGYARRWAPPGVLSEDVSEVGTGHVFKSTDAGATFTDISADLPDVPLNALTTRGGQLIAASDIGVFLSRDLNGGAWEHLDGLPTAPVYSLQLKPGDDRTLVVAAYGRSAWTFHFDSAPLPHPGVTGHGGELPATGSSTNPMVAVLAMVVALALLAARTRGASNR